MIKFGRGLCSNYAVSSQREWLVTNGNGSYASGSIVGSLTRRYHGYLIAALNPPLGRTLLVAKFDETVTYDGQNYPLHTNSWAEADHTHGYVHLNSFHLEGTTPVWTFALADALLEKRIWMQIDANTTYIRYDFRQGKRPLTLDLKALVNYRDHHGATQANGWQMQVTPVTHGLQVTAYPDAMPFYLQSDQATATPHHMWYNNYYLSHEAYRGLNHQEDHLHAGSFHVILEPDTSITIVVSTETNPNLNGLNAYAERQAHEQQLLVQANVDPIIQHLVLAADQFIVRRSLPGNPDGRTIIAGYPWFGDWGRDTMISLPGLTLATGRPTVARQILQTFAGFVNQGMLPNRFPDQGAEPAYNTVDATLWYFEAIRAYHAATDDNELLQELIPVLQDIITWHQRGTRYNIHQDLADGLLIAGQAGVQLTWMDAKVGEWVVTPRIGKPVEINALWYNALRSLSDFMRVVGQSGQQYDALAERVKQSFTRFWNDETGFCYDVIDGPQGEDGLLRPNQLLAVSLPHSPLSDEQQRAVVAVCIRRLLTPHGLRSLSPDEHEYIGHYGGNSHERDSAYHQGIVWGWLIGPFIAAYLRVYNDPVRARAYLEPMLSHLADHGLGSVSEIFDGTAPFTARGCFAQAWSVAELLRAWQITTINHA